MDMSDLNCPPFLVFVPSRALEDDDCSQLTTPFEDGDASRIVEEEDDSRIMASMENELDFSERTDEDLRRLRHALMESDFEDLRKLRHGQKPARRGSAKTTRTTPTADSAADHDVTPTAGNGSRRRLPSAKKHLKKFGSFLSLKEVKSKDDRGASIDKRVAAYDKSGGLPVATIKCKRCHPAAA